MKKSKNFTFFISSTDEKYKNCEKNNFFTFFSVVSELLWDMGTKVCSNGPGHMTKMANMPIRIW